MKISSTKIVMLVLLAVVSAVVGLTSAASEPAGRAATTAVDWQPEVPARAWRSIVLHHSATAQGDVASIDAVHRRRRDAAGRPWLGIGYHFVIGNGKGMDDGEVQATFRWRQQLTGAHAGTQKDNEHGIGICLIGDFDSVAPTAQQLAATQQLVVELARQYAIPRPRVLRHADLRATQCPGRKFPFAEVAARVPATAAASGEALVHPWIGTRR